MATLLETQLFEFFAVSSEPEQAPEGLACLLCGAWTGAAQCDCHLRRRDDDLALRRAQTEEVEEFSIEEVEEETAPYEPDTEDSVYEQRYNETWARYGRCDECRAKHTVDELALADLRLQVEKLREQNARLQQQLDEATPLQEENLRLHAEVDRLKRLCEGELLCDRPKRACRRDSAVS